MIKRTLEICGEIEKMVFQQTKHVECVIMMQYCGKEKK